MIQTAFDVMALPGLTRATRMRNARAAADSAIGRAADRADRDSPQWIAQAVEALRVFARNQAGIWTIEQARSVIDQTLPAPVELRVWGHVSRAAAKAGYIERAKGQTLPAASSNGSPKICWRRGKNA